MLFLKHALRATFIRDTESRKLLQHEAHGTEIEKHLTPRSVVPRAYLATQSPMPTACLGSSTINHKGNLPPNLFATEGAQPHLVSNSGHPSFSDLFRRGS